MSTSTDLVYNIVEQTLRGKIDTVEINAHAVSGGRAGSKEKGAVDHRIADNPFATHLKKTSDRPGGPTPLRRFSLKTHETRPNWIRLIPLAGEDLGDRSGFAIHGRGTRGSDGCIVPTAFHNVLLIWKLVKAREDAGKPAPTLAVVAIGDLTRFAGPTRIA